MRDFDKGKFHVLDKYIVFCKKEIESAKKFANKMPTETTQIASSGRIKILTQILDKMLADKVKIYKNDKRYNSQP